MSPSWKPILEGERAREAVSVAREIADALIGYMADEGAEDRRLGPQLAGGYGGLALMFAYLDAHLPENGYQDAAMDALERALGRVEETLGSVALYGGFPGVAWTVAHLETAVWESGDLDDLEPLDEALHHVLGSPWQWDYDLISGLVGMGVYALERPDSELMGVCVARVVEQLGARSEPGADGHGVTWMTGPELLPEHQREIAPEGYHNLGLAHGVPGVIAVLAMIVRAGGPASDAAAALLRQAMAWFVAQIGPDSHPSGVRAWLPVGREPAGPATTRAAWCYGDPGAAIALLQGARALGDTDMEARAVALGLRTARRPADDCGVVDAGLCHGAAGLGHVFNRMYQATGEDAFADRARYWFERTIEMRKPGQGLAGYLAYEAGPSGEPDWLPSPGLLTGVAGIALALSAATCAITPEWDRHLLCAVGCE